MQNEFHTLPKTVEKSDLAVEISLSLSFLITLFAKPFHHKSAR
jgi:hypothetical protein